MPTPDDWIAEARAAHRVDRWQRFDPRGLEPEGRIRKLCEDDLCGNFGCNHQCPPSIGSLEACRKRLEGYGGAVLLQTTYEVAPQDRADTMETQVTFHHALLAVEGAARAAGEPEAWGLVGGPCALCQPCTAVLSEPCPHPERARPSLEALGVDVVALQESLGWDGAFHADRVTWTGAIFFEPAKR